MRAYVILGLLLMVSLTVAACGATQALAGANLRPKQAVTVRPGSRGGSQTLEEPVDNTPLRLLFIGASVTDGWFASSKDHAYPALVARGLAGGRRVRIQMLARPGVTAQEAGEWNLSAPSDVVVVQIATNDFVKDVPVDVYAAAYTGLLDRLRVASPKAELICLGAWLDPSSKNRIGVAAVDYDVAARTACESDGGRYVDLSAAYMDARNHGPVGRATYDGPGDLFHPNDRGHAELASLILDADRVPDTETPSPI